MNKQKLLKAYPQLMMLPEKERNTVSIMLVKDINKNRRSLKFYDDAVKETMMGNSKGKGKDVTNKVLEKQIEKLKADILDLEWRIHNLSSDFTIKILTKKGRSELIENINQLKEQKNAKEEVLKHLEEQINATDYGTFSLKGTGFVSSLLGSIPRVINKISGKKLNPEWVYNPKPGENHTTLIRDGMAYTDRFTGPQTQVFKNINELIQRFGSLTEALANADKWSPDSAVSLAGMLHDVQYALAGQEYMDGDKKASEDRVQMADKRFLRDLMRSKSMINAVAPGALIKAKSDVLNYASFIDKTKQLKPEEIELYNEVLREFGLSNEVYNYPSGPSVPFQTGGYREMNPFEMGVYKDRPKRNRYIL